MNDSRCNQLHTTFKVITEGAGKQRLVDSVLALLTLAVFAGIGVLLALGV